MGKVYLRLCSGELKKLIKNKWTINVPLTKNTLLDTLGPLD